MDLNNIEIIKKIENEIFIDNNFTTKKYKKFNKLWINSSLSLQKINDSQIPGIQFYPTLNFKYWLRYFYEIFVKKSKRKTNIGNLLGLYLSWFFLEKASATLKADYIYEYLSLVIFYTEEKYLIKTCNYHYPWHEGIRKEVNLQSLVLSVLETNDSIGMPKIISTELESSQPYFIQELIQGKDLNSFNKRKKKQVYGLVFETMFSIYPKVGIKLMKKPSTINFEFIEKLEQYFTTKSKNDIFKAIKNILEKDLFLPFCFLHSDLKGGNLIIDSKNKIWIIDWLGAKENYMIFELDNPMIDLKKNYYQFCNDLNFNTSQLYDFNEQIVLKRLILLNNQFNFENINQKKVHIQFEELNKFIVENILEAK